MWGAFAFLFIISNCLCENAEVYNVTVVDVPLATLKTSPGSRIIGGQPTTIERYPFTVQVLYNNQLSCAGSLVTSRHVLSAAHCFIDQYGALFNARLFTIRAGSTTLNTGGTIRSVSRIIVHERYNYPVRDNDIAVLVLNQQFSLGSSIAVASIPRQGADVADNVTVIHVGWGRTNALIPVVSTFLQEVAVYTVNRALCAQRYAYLQAQVLEAFPVTENMICAGLLDVGGRDACQGDSGGPLIYNNSIVVGVTSWGYGCAEAFFPGVSARVSSYTNWIVNTVERSGAAKSNANAISVVVSLIFCILLYSPS